jgi:hypothetical protein
VSGTITAQTLVVQTVTSSVVYSSGSNVFGNSGSNTQTFTGSLLVTGSSHTVLGNLGVGGAPNERLSVTGPLGLQGFVRWSDGIATSAFLGITGSTAFIHANNNILGFGANGTNNYSPAMVISSSNVLIGDVTSQLDRNANIIGSKGFAIQYGSSTGTYLDIIPGAANGTVSLKADARSGGYPDMVFYTTNTERLRITSGGTLQQTIPNDASGLFHSIPSNSYSGYVYSYVRNLGGSYYLGLERLSGSGLCNGATTYSTVLTSNNDTALTLGTNSAARLIITGAGVVRSADGSTSRPILQYSQFGYSSGQWKTVILGSSSANYTTDGVTLCFNVDVSGNTSGAYSGDGREYIFRNVGSFITPNSSNNGYNTLLSWNSSGVVTVTTSDYRAKEDLKSFEALPMVEAMKLYDFRWIELQERMHGVLAHELQEVVPYAVMGEKDGERMQGVDYSKLVPIMLKAIQELKADNDAIRAELAALKS